MSPWMKFRGVTIQVKPSQQFSIFHAVWNWKDQLEDVQKHNFKSSFEVYFVINCEFWYVNKSMLILIKVLYYHHT